MRRFRLRRQAKFVCFTYKNAAIATGHRPLLGAGVGVIILSGCCAWVLWVGLGLTLLGLGALLVWRDKCGKSWCTVAKEITYVIGGIVLPIVSYILYIPGISDCVNGLALAWVGAVFGPIAAIAAACTA